MKSRNITVLKEKFLDISRKKNRSPRSVELFAGCLDFFIRFLQMKYRASPDVREVNREQINSFMDYVSKYKKKDGKLLSLKRKNLLLYLVKQFFSFLEREGFIFMNPVSHIELEKVPKAFPKDILTEEEVSLLMKAPPSRTMTGIRDRCLFEILYGSALRCLEVRSLKLSDVDLQKGYLFVSGKGQKDRVVPMTRTARYYLKRYLTRSRPFLSRNNPGEETLFVAKGGFPFSKNAVAEQIKTYALKAGIKKHVTPHTLRHTCASHLIARGASVRYVQELLGHSDISTTQIYTRVMPMDLQRVYQATHPRCLKKTDL
jgi:integrase/recombinase XerD